MLTIQATFAQTVARLRVAQSKIEEVDRQAHRAMGVQAVAWAVQDYRKRGRGGIDASGASWRKLTRDGIRARVAKRRPWQSIGDRLANISRREAPIREELRKSLPAGRGKGAQRGAAAKKFKERDGRLMANRKARETLRSKRRAMVDKELAKHEVGVDTGRLINSLVHGEPALAKIRTARAKGPSPPKAEFRLTSRSITVGSNLNYAKAFDRLRKIFPPGFITRDRERKLQELAVELHEANIRDATEEGTL